MTQDTSLIWTLRVKIPQSLSECVRVLEIDSGASLLQLHEAIQSAVDFDNDHLFQFYLGRHPDQYGYIIGGEPDWDRYNPIKVYREISLSEIWPLPKGYQMYYLFDFGDNWVFQVNKTRHRDKLPQPGVVYPRVIEARGKNPEQYPEWEDEDE